MTDKKIKILTLSDHPLSPSGVGTQTKYIIEGLLATGRYEFISLGGAIKHSDYSSITTDKWGDQWTIFPVDGYGTPEMLRSIIRTQKPDMLWFMTDPRFWGWLWDIEHEIRPLLPMVYYHVWDNFPPPFYNKNSYNSNDVIAAISKVTHELVKTVSPDVESVYIPHSVDTEIFKKLPEEAVAAFRAERIKNETNPDRVLFFWNNRNARRKQGASLIFWFKKFLDIIGHENACLVMHTDPKDVHGQDLEAIIHHLELTHGQVVFSRAKISPEDLAMVYNMMDCTINVSDAEGFGLATLESLACGTPIIANMTGGLQEQVTDGENWFGVGLEPTSKAIIGSQEIPYIYEDRLSEAVVVEALLQIYNLSKEEREKLGEAGRLHVEKNYNFENYTKQWDKLLTETYKKRGSWTTRKLYNSWTLEEVA